MNLEQHQLSLIALEPFQIKEVLRCVLHTILFHRTLGSIVPQEVDCDILDVSYVRVRDTAIERAVEANIERFSQALNKSREQKSTVSLSFYAKAAEASWFLLAKEKKMYWERWILPILLTDKPKTAVERARRHETQQSAVRDLLLQVIQVVNEKKDHIPPVKPNTNHFPFEITWSCGVGSAGDDLWGFNTLKKMLKQGLAEN